MPVPFFRPSLVDTILDLTRPVVVLEAPAGMGKSSVLRQLAERFGAKVSVGVRPPSPVGETAVWDIPPDIRPDRLPETFLEGSGRLFIAKRPETKLPGLDRAYAYGKVAFVPPSLLLLSPQDLSDALGSGAADAAWQRSLGWPILALESLGDEEVTAFLADALSQMTSSDLVQLACRRKAGAPTTSPKGFEFLDAGSALAERTGLAIDRLLAGEGIDDHRGAEIAQAFIENGMGVDAVRALQRAGDFDRARNSLQNLGGIFALSLFGPETFDLMLAGFPETYGTDSEVMTLARAIQALKYGDIGRARYLLEAHFGASANDPEQVYAADTGFSREFRAFRLVMMIYEGYLPSPELLERCFALASEFPLNDHLSRGTCYNSLLEFHIRYRRFAEAEILARQALYHYERAQAPLLVFYIHLHQAFIRLLAADTLAARRYSVLAAASLSRVPFSNPNDRRLQNLMDACIEYESGRTELLAEFVSADLDGFSNGEVWPSLLEFSLHYGSQALADHFSLITARNFLDGWRVSQVSIRSFQVMISIREAVLLQSANRWQEAGQRLAAIQPDRDRRWLLRSGDSLAYLKDSEEVAVALAWLRQLVYETPTLAELDKLVAAMAGNFNLTGRQRISAEIWLAYVCWRSRDLSRARAILNKTFEDCDRLGTIAPLAEERIFVEELINNQRVGAFLSTLPAARQVIRKLRDSGRLSAAPGKRSGLTRRETKILLMVAEGMSNKSVASKLGVTERTVKFHLGNSFRKLGCRNRNEAVSAARTLGIAR